MSKTKQYLETLEEEKIKNLNSDLFWEHEQHKEWQSNCSECYKLCKYCMGTGTVERTEWTDTDTSYPVYQTCVCQEVDI